MRYTLIGQLPRHLYVWVDSAYTHEKPVGFVRAVWHGLVSYPGRVWGCTMMLESGAIYRNLPPQAIAFMEQPEAGWTERDAQTWDCYSWEFTTIEYDLLRGLGCKARTYGGEFIGEYLFTAASVGDGFSAAPEQAKEFSFIKLDNGRLTIQPTNHVIFQDRSFTDGKMEFPTGLKRQMETWSCE